MLSLRPQPVLGARIALAILLAGLVLTTVTTAAAERNARHAFDARLDVTVQQAADRAWEALGRYEDLVHNVASGISLQADAPAQELAEFQAAAAFERRYPGIEGALTVERSQDRGPSGVVAVPVAGLSHRYELRGRVAGTDRLVLAVVDLQAALAAGWASERDIAVTVRDAGRTGEPVVTLGDVPEEAAEPSRHIRTTMGRTWLVDVVPLTAPDRRLPVALALVGTALSVLTVVTLQELSARRGTKAELAQLSLHDQLTGLPNRRLLADRLADLLRACPAMQRVAVLFIDLDRFKVINESQGHAAGDEVITAAAERLQSCLRPGDVAARVGGDEFVILCPALTGRRQARALGERLAGVLRVRLHVDDAELVVTASVGATLSTAGAEPEQLLREADVAMQQAKREGGDRVRLYSSGLGSRASARFEVEQDLRLAVDRGELVLHYQPVVALGSGARVGIEGLIRWAHPRKGLLAPAAFLDVAEETGLIADIGAWALERACADFAGRPGLGDGLPPPKVGVNLSARELADPGLADRVEAVLDRTGMEPSRLVLEVTEHALQRLAPPVRHGLARLRRRGVLLALDDFGTGYASLTLLRELPVDILKIDRSFVAGLATDPHDEAIVAAVIRLAQSLRLTVVAEGIEDDAQAAALRALGCEFAQGYRFSRPVPLAELLAAGGQLVDAASPPSGDEGPRLGGQAERSRAQTSRVAVERLSV